MINFFTNILCFLIIFESYNYGINFVNNQYVPADYVVMADEITEKVEAKLTKRYNMRTIGTIGGMADRVNMLGLSFQIHGPLSKDKLRRILIDCIEEFLTPINANEKLRPFLKTYPYTVEGLIIEIFVVDDTGKKVYDPNIMLAETFQGELKYRLVDKDTKFGYKSTEKEDYETALKIVQNEKNKTNLKN